MDLGADCKPTHQAGIGQVGDRLKPNKLGSLQLRPDLNLCGQELNKYKTRKGVQQMLTIADGG